MIEDMHKGRVKMDNYHVAMQFKGLKTEDIFPFGRVVVSAIGAADGFRKILLKGNNPLNGKHLQRGNRIRKAVPGDAAANPTRVT